MENCARIVREVFKPCVSKNCTGAGPVADQEYTNSDSPVSSVPNTASVTEEPVTVAGVADAGVATLGAPLVTTTCTELITTPPVETVIQ